MAPLTSCQATLKPPELHCGSSWGLATLEK